MLTAFVLVSQRKLNAQFLETPILLVVICGRAPWLLSTWQGRRSSLSPLNLWFPLPSWITTCDGMRTRSVLLVSEKFGRGKKTAEFFGNNTGARREGEQKVNELRSARGLKCRGHRPTKHQDDHPGSAVVALRVKRSASSLVYPTPCSGPSFHSLTEMYCCCALARLHITGGRVCGKQKRKHKRAIKTGALLGYKRSGKVEVTNCL